MTMKAGARPRFDLDALRDLAGAKVFARGEIYQGDGLVRLLALEPGRVLAQVAGTEDYRTELKGRGRQISGECSCPAFEDWGFCKHMVATALAANAAGGDAEAEGAGALSRIRDHLKQKGVDALVAMIVDLAERDPALFRKLDLAAAAVHADDKTLEARLRKAIDGATRTRGFVDYGAARGWADGVDAALGAVAALASGPRAGIALKLMEHGIARIEGAAAEIDDSDGHCGALMHRARDIHCAAACASRPEPVQLARDLFARETGSDYGIFDGAAALYADALGEKGLAEYRRLAVEAWEKLPPRSGKARERPEFSGNYRQLGDILDFFAERDGDVDARIALRAKDLSSPWSYLHLAEFCLAQGRGEEALRRAEEGLWLFEDAPPDERLVLFAVDLLAKAGRKKDAATQLRRAFEKAPSLELYAKLRKLGGEAARDSAVTFLETRLAAKTAGPWNVADLLVRILMEEKMFDAAWAAAPKYAASTEAKAALAEASEATHPREAVAVYSGRIDHLVETGAGSSYAQAAKLVARMAGLRSAAEQADYVAALKTRFGRKRNFMKLLE
jgi:hypothetical protein